MKSRSQPAILAVLLSAACAVTHAMPIADANGPYTADEGSPITLDGSGSSFATTYAWDLDNDGSYDDATGVAPSFTRADDATFIIGLLVSDGTDTDQTSAVVTINNVAPLVDAGGDATLATGATFISSSSFTDPGADSWTAAIDYGDGSAPAPLAFNLDLTFDISHVYTGAPGAIFTGSVTVTDDDGGVGVDTYMVRLRSVAEPASGVLALFGLLGLLCTGRRRTALR